jgi:hypothetical protein
VDPRMAEHVVGWLLPRNDTQRVLESEVEDAQA